LRPAARRGAAHNETDPARAGGGIKRLCRLWANIRSAKASVRAKRKKAAWDDDYMLQLLAE
jgi:hypothetical protein